MYGRSTCRISALDPRHHKRGSAARHAARAVTPLHYHSVMHRKQGRRRFSRTVFWHDCRRLNMTALSPSSCAAMQCLCPVPLSPAACWSRCSLSEFSAESVRRMVGILWWHSAKKSDASLCSSLGCVHRYYPRLSPGGVLHAVKLICDAPTDEAHPVGRVCCSR